MKRLLIYSEIRDSDDGNCIPLENIAILTSSQNSEQIINNSTLHKPFNDNIQLNYNNAIANIREDSGTFQTFVESLNFLFEL